MRVPTDKPLSQDNVLTQGGIRLLHLVWLCNQKFCRVLQNPKDAKGGWGPCKTTCDFRVSLLNTRNSLNES